ELQIKEPIYFTEGNCQCSQYEQEFSQKKTLIKNKKIYTGNKPYQCSHCDKPFSTNTNLSHESVIRKHTREKPYQCSQCDKAFLRKCDLIGHQTTHTGEKPYQCSQCDKAFSRKGYLI
ncbi:unnamed protein product, partial [Meganyctiphanes norvegica]